MLQLLVMTHDLYFIPICFVSFTSWSYIENFKVVKEHTCNYICSKDVLHKYIAREPHVHFTFSWFFSYHQAREPSDFNLKQELNIFYLAASSMHLTDSVVFLLNTNYFLVLCYWQRGSTFSLLKMP